MQMLCKYCANVVGLDWNLVWMMQESILHSLIISREVLILTLALWTFLRPRQISWSSGMYNPIHPSSRQCTDTILPQYSSTVLKILEQNTKYSSRNHILVKHWIVHCHHCFGYQHVSPQIITFCNEGWLDANFHHDYTKLDNNFPLAPKQGGKKGKKLYL